MKERERDTKADVVLLLIALVYLLFNVSRWVNGLLFEGITNGWEQKRSPLNLDKLETKLLKLCAHGRAKLCCSVNPASPRKNRQQAQIECANYCAV